MITFESIFSKKNVNSAITYLTTRKNGAGSDKQPEVELRNYWELNKSRILEEINSRTFQPNIVKEFEIINGRGKHRKVTSFELSDKFITRLLAQKFNTYFTTIFLENSYAYQENKGTVYAVEKAKEYIENGNEFVVEIDIKNFFDEINLELLLNIVSKYIKDERVIFLLKQYLFCKVMVDDDIYEKSRGIIQGNALSPCLSNIYLNSFDNYLEERGYNWLRFADNIYVYTASEQEGIKLYKELVSMLTERYDLPINENKSGIFDAFDRRLLGYDIYKKGKHIRVEKHSYQRNDYYRNWHECKLEKINREYHITKPGVLNKKDYALLFENEDERHHIPVEATEQLNIYNEITITDAVFRTLNAESVRLGLYNKYGDLIGYFVPETYSQDSKTVLAQCIEYTDSRKRLNVAKSMEMAAIHNIRANIRYYKKHNNDNKLIEIEKQLTEGIRRMNESQSVDELLLEEARCRQIYYHGFNLLLNKEYFNFDKRSKRPPMNPINALISFGNTLLYNRIQQILWKTSLDSRIGIFHAANRRHYSLNLDFADLFKPIIVDRVIFSLINRKQISDKHFIINDNKSVYLNDDGKKLFIESFMEKMDSKITVDNRSMKYQQLIEKDIQNYYKHIMNGEKYKPYKYY